MIFLAAAHAAMASGAALKGFNAVGFDRISRLRPMFALAHIGIAAIAVANGNMGRWRGLVRHERSGLLPLIHSSLAIACDCLVRTDRLGNPGLASRLIVQSIHARVRMGERRPTMLANRAIENHQRNCPEPDGLGSLR